jgi:alkylated DNA repair protein alkB family protein 6
MIDARLRPCAWPNHVLVNEYHRGAGITPHNDGDLYAPHVAIVTLSGSALMEFWPTEGPAVEDDSDGPNAPKPLTQVRGRETYIIISFDCTQ